MTADITHDLSTPLQLIPGFVEMLEGGEVEQTGERIEIIKTEIDYLRNLVGDLAALSQVEAEWLDIQLNPLEPAVWMEQVNSTYRPIASLQGLRFYLRLSTQPR